MTNIDSRFQDTLKDPRSVPSFNGVTERDFMEFSNMPDIEKEIEEGNKDAIAVQYADFIREQGYGSVVRESIARLSLWLDVKLNAIKDKNNSIYFEYKVMNDELERIRNEFEQVISAETIDGEVKLARHSDFINKTFNSLKDRLDFMEKNFYLFDNGQVQYTRTLLFNINQLDYDISIVKKIDEVPRDYPIIISEIGKDERFYFEGV